MMSTIYKQLNIKLGQFTQELNVVLTKIKNRKDAALDEIAPEVWKTGKFNDVLLQYYSAMYNQNTIEGWTKDYILLFPKKGDTGITKNYRGITLISIVVKVYNVLLLNCIQSEIEEILT